MANLRKTQTITNGRGSALIYCRVSTKGQEDGTSLESQAEACIKHSESLGYTVARVTKEIYSGAELWDRPMLSRDREDIRAGRFQAVIAYAIDRLSRDIAHLAILTDESERHGAKLLFVTEDLDDSPEGKLLRSVRGYVAEVEREKIKERTVRGKYQRLLSGKIYNLGPELYGYRRDKERGVRLIHESEAHIVRQIFEWVAMEGVGVFTIARRLNESATPSPWATKGFGTGWWNKTAIRNIIRNPNYKGETVAWVRKSDGKRTIPRPENEHLHLPEGVTPAIVTPALWQRAQERFANNKGDARRNERSPFLLRGHLTCAKCGLRMYPQPKQLKSGKVIRYYRCSSDSRYDQRTHGRRCGVSVVPADHCERWVWDQVKQYLQNPDLIAEEAERVRAEGIDPQLLQDRDTAQKALERSISAQQRLVKRLREADDELSAIIERELLQVEREKNMIQKTIADLDVRIAQQEQAVVNLKSLYDYCQDVAYELERFDFNDKRLALEALNVEVVANGYEWKLLGRLPWGVVEAVNVSSSYLRIICGTDRLARQHHLGAEAGSLRTMERQPSRALSASRSNTEGVRRTSVCRVLHRAKHCASNDKLKFVGHSARHSSPLSSCHHPMFSSRFKWNLEANRLALLLAEKKRAGSRILDLTESNPTHAGFDYSTTEILAALAAPTAMTYEPTPRGLLTARQAVADYYRERGEAVGPERLHLTASTSEGYAYLFKLLVDDGDAVLVPQPSYPLFEFLAALEGVELRPYELIYSHPRGWQIAFDSLERAASSGARAVIIVNPNNPTGSFIKRNELERLTAFCEARGLALIVDEVFSDYAFAPDEDRVSSFVSVSSALTFVMSGLSKTLALPQMKLGWIVTGGPAELRREAEERLDLIADTYLSVSAPVQHAAPAWLRLRTGLQRQIIERVHGNLDHLAQLTADSPCRLLKVEGGWYAVLEVPRHVSEEELVLALLAEDEVLVHPGYFFDFEREAFLVLSLLPPPEIFREAISRLLARAV